MFPVRSPRIRPRIELTKRDWENAEEGIGKKNVYICSFIQLFASKNKVVGYSYPHARFTRRKKKGRGGRGGGEGEGQGKGQGILMGQLIGEQCNSPLIQSTLHAPLRQSKLFAPFLGNYFKQFCALILLRKELI